jgi:2'-5' RNA ligase
VALNDYLAACQARAPLYNWVPALNLHFTVRFLGHIPLVTVEALRGALGRLRSPSFRLAMGEVGTFGSSRAPRVVWLGLREGEREAVNLAEEVEQACLSVGVPAADRPFHAHLTLARAGNVYGALPSLPKPPLLAPWDATELILYQSHMGRPHATYSPIGRFPLRPG